MKLRSPRSHAAPEIEVRQVSITRESEVGCWNIAWLVENKGHHRLQIFSACLPHGQFKAGEIGFEPPLRLAAGESGRFQVLVRCHEPPGLVTENAFVIFTGDWFGEAWRIFVRLRVVADADGTPRAATELITTQKAGFSGVGS